jgi:hypothetical protein
VATERDDVRTARLLLARGADADTRSGSPSAQLSPLEPAGASAALALLLDRGARDKDAALALAAQKGHGGAAAALLAAGANCAAVCGQDGRAALHHAAAGGHAGVVRALLRAGADANQKTSWEEQFVAEMVQETQVTVGEPELRTFSLIGSSLSWSPDGRRRRRRRRRRRQQQRALVVRAWMARTSNALCFGGRPGALYRVVLRRRAALGGA